MLTCGYRLLLAWRCAALRLSLPVLPANGFSTAFKEQETTLKSGQEGDATQGIGIFPVLSAGAPMRLDSELVAKLVIFSCHQLLCVNMKWTAEAQNSAPLRMRVL